MIYRYNIRHIKDEYWSVDRKMLVDPAYANRVIVDALADDDWQLARDWMEFERRAGWMGGCSVADYYLHLCFSPAERSKLIQRGYWRQIAALKVGQSMTVPLVLY